MPPGDQRLQDLTTDYDFILATPKDRDLLVDLCTKHFTRLEVHCKALGLNEEETRPIFEWIVDSCILYPYTIKVVEKASGEVVAIRLMSVGQRKTGLDIEDDGEDEDSGMSEKLEKLTVVLEKAKKLFWDMVDVKKVLRREISFVLPSHQRKGIARRLVWEALDVNDLKAQGIQGIVSEASSLANQALLQSEGFQYIVKPDYYWADKVEEGSEGMKVLFKPF